MNNDWWLFLKSTDEEEMKRLQSFRNEIDFGLSQRQWDEENQQKERFDRLTAMVREMLSKPKQQGGLNIGRRFIETEEPEEQFQEEPQIEHRYDEKAGSVQPRAMVHIEQQKRPRGDETDMWAKHQWKWSGRPVHHV